MIAPGSGGGALPDVADPAVTVISFEQRDVADAIEQRAVAEAMVATWAEEPRPEQLRSVSSFVSVDPVARAGILRGTEAGDVPRMGVATYVQWTSAPTGARLRTFERYRSYEPATAGPGPVPGCVVFVTIDFDGRDQGRLRRWIDCVVAALAAEPEPAPGLIAAHFHASTDGSRVLNYAEWASAGAIATPSRAGPAASARSRCPSGATSRSSRASPPTPSGASPCTARSPRPEVPVIAPHDRAVWGDPALAQWFPSPVEVDLRRLTSSTPRAAEVLGMSTTEGTPDECATGHGVRHV